MNLLKSLENHEFPCKNKIINIENAKSIALETIEKLNILLDSYNEKIRVYEKLINDNNGVEEVIVSDYQLCLNKKGITVSRINNFKKILELVNNEEEELVYLLSVNEMGSPSIHPINSEEYEKEKICEKEKSSYFS